MTMKLEDWPIWINDGYGKHWYECFLPTPDDEGGPNCYGEELEHWTAHNAKMAELTYRRIGTYMINVAEEWNPHGDA